jgi:hypothetical protein
MTSHDPLCPVLPISAASGLVRGLCLCPEFALVRADERSKAARLTRDAQDNYADIHENQLALPFAGEG